MLIVGIVFFIYFYYLELHAGSFPYNTSNLNVLERNILIFATACILCQIVIEGNIHPYVNNFLMVIIATLVIIFLIWVFKRYFYELILKPCWNGLESKPNSLEEHLKGHIASN